MKLSRIYPTLSYPVSRGTANLSSLIRWDHKDDWHVMPYKYINRDETSERSIEVNLQNGNFEFLNNCKIDGKVLIPGSFLLQLIAESFASIKNVQLMEMCIQFQNVKFLEKIYMSGTTPVKLQVMIHRGTGNFSVSIESNMSITEQFVLYNLNL